MGPRMNFILRMKFRFFLMGVIVAGSLGILALFAEIFRLVTQGPSGEGDIKILTNEEQIERDLDRLKRGDTNWKEDPHFQLPILIDWNSFLPTTSRNRTCNGHTCYFTQNRNYLLHPMTRNIFFRGNKFSVKDMPVPRDEQHDWALFHDSDPSLNPILSHSSILKLFNHTATFSSHSDLPLTLRHLESLAYLKDESLMLNYVEKGKLINENNISPIGYFEWDCETASERDSYVLELMKYIKVDSFGMCLNNMEGTKKVSENSDELLELMANYKFVLVLEKTVCDDFIGPRLWQALHVGSVPLYFGSETVSRWIPNPLSIIRVTEFKTPESLAGHVKMLQKNLSKYSAYLQHKPSYNNNYFTLVTNKQLEEFNLNLKYIHNFECLVCERVSKNEKIIKIGFKGYPYHSNENKLKCPGPKSILSCLGISPNIRSSMNNLQRKWIKSKYESNVIQTLALHYPGNFTVPELEGRIVNLARKDKLPMDHFLKK